MQYEVTALRRVENVVFNQVQAVELHRDESREKIVVVPAQVDDFGVAFLHER